MYNSRIHCQDQKLLFLPPCWCNKFQIKKIYSTFCCKLDYQFRLWCSVLYSTLKMEAVCFSKVLATTKISQCHNQDCPFTLKLEAASPSKTLATTYKTKQCHTTKDCNLNSHCHEPIKSHTNYNIHLITDIACCHYIIMSNIFLFLNLGKC
jgi:hypothetical protein